MLEKINEHQYRHEETGFVVEKRTGPEGISIDIIEPIEGSESLRGVSDDEDIVDGIIQMHIENDDIEGAIDCLQQARGLPEPTVDVEDILDSETVDYWQSNVERLQRVLDESEYEFTELWGHAETIRVNLEMFKEKLEKCGNQVVEGGPNG